MKALPDCDVPRAVCASRTHSGKESFICYCKPGFTGRSSQCIGNDVFLLRMQLLNLTVTTFLNHTAFFRFSDVDECVNKDANKCSTDALCTNTAGGYECRCKDGFIGNGFSCQGNSDRSFTLHFVFQFINHTTNNIDHN